MSVAAATTLSCASPKQVVAIGEAFLTVSVVDAHPHGQTLESYASRKLKGNVFGPMGDLIVAVASTAKASNKLQRYSTLRQSQAPTVGTPKSADGKDRRSIIKERTAEEKARREREAAERASAKEAAARGENSVAWSTGTLSAGWQRQGGPSKVGGKGGGTAAEGQGEALSLDGRLEANAVEAAFTAGIEGSAAGGANAGAGGGAVGASPASAAAADPSAA